MKSRKEWNMVELNTYVKLSNHSVKLHEEIMEKR